MPILSNISDSAFGVTVKRVSDTDADLSFLEHDSGNYKGESPEDIAKYEAQDLERLDAYHRGDWEMLGVQVTVARNGIILGRASLYGIESDSGEEYFKEVEKELTFKALNNAKDVLASLITDL